MSYEDDKQAWDDFWKGRGSIVAVVIIAAVILAAVWDTITRIF